MKSQRSKVEEDWSEITDMVREMLSQLQNENSMDRSVQIALLRHWSDTLMTLSKFHEKP